MVKSYTAKYTKIDSGYMGQLIEWPEVITESHGLEECRSMLRDALQEMVLAYQDQGKETPASAEIFEQMTVELENDDAAGNQSRESFSTPRSRPSRPVGTRAASPGF